MQKRQIRLLSDILIHVPEAYNDNMSSENTGLKVVISMGDVKYTVRHGTVVSTPLLYNTIVKPGDVIYFHHNIIRRTQAMDRTVMHGAYEIDRQKGLYNCPLEQVFGIERDGVFMSLEPYCFVKPVENKTITFDKGIACISGEVEKPNLGTIKYGNRELAAKGVDEGDKIVFKLDSEYQFNIHGEKLYRMRTKSILAKYYD